MKTYFQIITWYSCDVDTHNFSLENLLGLSEALLRLLQHGPLGGERNVSDVVIGSRNVPDIFEQIPSSELNRGRFFVSSLHGAST